MLYYQKCGLVLTRYALLSINVPREQWGMYKKWARFYLHICAKYKHNPTDTKSIPLFIKKLASKNQTKNQRAQAQAAGEIFHINYTLKLPAASYGDCARYCGS